MSLVSAPRLTPKRSFPRRWCLVAAISVLPACGAPEGDLPHWSERPLVRVEGNPLLRPGMPGLGGPEGANINGPSVITVPDWVESPLGRYYMYFAHHRGRYIRLAVADDPAGPWRIHRPGVLRLEQTVAVGHIGSPEVVVDEAERTIRMYFHGPSRERPGQRTFLATSSDGLRFETVGEDLGLPYFRVFRFEGAYYAIGKRGSEAGVLLRSDDGLGPFEKGPDLIPRMRHASLYREGDRLVVFYSRIGDTPERLLRSDVRLTGDWMDWVAGPPVEVLRPVETYEGADRPILTSVPGAAEGPVHELRDPALLNEGNAYYLYYSVAGEQGIAMARFADTPK